MVKKDNIINQIVLIHSILINNLNSSLESHLFFGDGDVTLDAFGDDANRYIQFLLLDLSMKRICTAKSSISTDDIDLVKPMILELLDNCI